MTDELGVAILATRSQALRRQVRTEGLGYATALPMPLSPSRCARARFLSMLVLIALSREVGAQPDTRDAVIQELQQRIEALEKKLQGQPAAPPQPAAAPKAPAAAPTPSASEEAGAADEGARAL